MDEFMEYKIIMQHYLCFVAFSTHVLKLRLLLATGHSFLKWKAFRFMSYNRSKIPSELGQLIFFKFPSFCLTSFY